MHLRDWLCGFYCCAERELIPRVRKVNLRILEECMVRLDDLRLFLTVLEQGSLTAGAAKVHRSLPTVSRTIAGLETWLGVRLLERSTRNISVTEPGRRLAVQAQRLLAEFDEAVGEIIGEASEPRGLLRITAPLTFGRMHVTPIVGAYLDLYPKVKVEMNLSDRFLDLAGDGIDVAVRIGKMADSSLKQRRVGEVRRVLVASPDYLSTHGEPQEPRDLRRHDLIFFSDRAAAPEWQFGTRRTRRAVRLSPRLIVDQIDTALQLTRAGRGIARALSYQVSEDISTGRLIRLLPHHEPEPLPVSLVFSGARHLPARVRRFVDLAATRFQENEAIRMT